MILLFYLELVYANVGKQRPTHSYEMQLQQKPTHIYLCQLFLAQRHRHTQQQQCRGLCIGVPILEPFTQNPAREFIQRHASNVGGTIYSNRPLCLAADEEWRHVFISGCTVTLGTCIQLWPTLLISTCEF